MSIHVYVKWEPDGQRDDMVERCEDALKNTPCSSCAEVRREKFPIFYRWSIYESLRIELKLRI